jgi:hypothetical protein
LTTLFGTDVEHITLSDAAVPAKKYGWLPLLVVLFLISYGLMTLLIVEQGQTIESQRVLIRELFRDSSELSASKMKAGRAHAQSNPVQAPSAEAPANQAPSQQAQVAPQHRAQIGTTKPKSDFQMPSRPAADLSDSRRSLITI